MAKLFFIGDSITAGAWDDRGGWAGRLIGQILSKSKTSEKKHQGFYCMPYNLGISGDTAPDVLRRLEKEVTARVYGGAEDDTIQLVFAFGVNDSICDTVAHKNCYADKEFQNDFHAIMKVAKKFTTNISFLGPLPVDEARVNPVPWVEDRAYTSKNVQHFNTMIESLCAAHDVAFLSLFDKWNALPDINDYFSDGLHPNSKGHALMAQQIGEFLLTPEFEVFHTKG